MKFISIFEEQRKIKKGEEGRGEADRILNAYTKKADFALLYHACELNEDSRSVRATNKKILKDWRNLVETSGLEPALDTLVVDLTTDKEEALGGRVVPIEGAANIFAIVGLFFTFIVSTMAAGVLEEVGKDIYKFIIKQIRDFNKKPPYSNYIVKVVVKDSKTKSNYIFFLHLDFDTFAIAWRAMLKQIKKEQKAKSRQEITLIFDELKGEWFRLGVAGNGV